MTPLIDVGTQPDILDAFADMLVDRGYDEDLVRERLAEHRGTHSEDHVWSYIDACASAVADWLELPWLGLPPESD